MNFIKTKIKNFLKFYEHMFNIMPETTTLLSAIIVLFLFSLFASYSVFWMDICSFQYSLYQAMIGFGFWFLILFIIFVAVDVYVNLIAPPLLLLVEYFKIILEEIKRIPKLLKDYKKIDSK